MALLNLDDITPHIERNYIVSIPEYKIIDNDKHAVGFFSFNSLLLFQFLYNIISLS